MTEGIQDIYIKFENKQTNKITYPPNASVNGFCFLCIWAPMDRDLDAQMTYLHVAIKTQALGPPNCSSS